MEHYLLALAAHASVDLAKSGLSAAIRHVAKKRLDLEAAAVQAQAQNNASLAERIFEEAVGVIIAEAAAGKIEVDKAAITALKGVKFDHQHGRIQIQDSTVAAEVLVTGGSPGATGETNIGGNTSLRSKGTAIDVGKGASIKITGGAPRSSRLSACSLL